MSTTLVVDTGQTIVGILSADDESYVAYYGPDIAAAIVRLEEVDEFVTYNGCIRDIPDLESFSWLHRGRGFQPKGAHTDMRLLVWSDEIWGSNLYDTYLRYFPAVPKFPDTFEGRNQKDVCVTLRLWQAWKAGRISDQRK